MARVVAIGMDGEGGQAGGRNPVRSLLPVIGGIVALAIVFRDAVFSGFDLGFGDRADAIIEISILEHWRNVLSGAAVWHTTGYFHPYVGTLGYNDGYLLYGMVYAFWRLFADPFHADTLNILTFKTIGYVAAYVLVSRTLRWGRGVATLVAVLWTVANNLWLQAIHAQLQSVALLPVAMLLAIRIVHAEREARHAAARTSAAALAAVMAAWLMTSYYMAWFTIFSAYLYVACWCVLSGRWRPGAIWSLFREHAGTLTTGFGVFAVLIVPFLALYLPKMRETGGEPVQVMLGYLVTPVVDMVNVGAGNYLWGWLFRALATLIHAVAPADPDLPHRVLANEHMSGLPPIFAVLAIIAAWRVVGRRVAAPVELHAFALMLVIAWALTLQFWLASPWILVFELVPGAKGMRVVSRYQLWLTLPFLLLVAAVWRQRAGRAARARPRLAGAVVALLVAENLNAQTPAQLSRAEQLAALSRIPAPPEECRSFYAVVTRPGEATYASAELDALYPHNVDAMLLAELWRVPTVNGFSTFNPPDWIFQAPKAPGYDARALAYARRHRLTGLCRAGHAAAGAVEPDHLSPRPG